LYRHAEWEGGQEAEQQAAECLRQAAGTKPPSILPAQTTGLVNHNVFLIFLFPKQNWNEGRGRERNTGHFIFRNFSIQE
jgi:hypothetical protein